MLCPTCKDQSLTMADRQDVEIDYCPKCQGGWLDRGKYGYKKRKSILSEIFDF